MENKDYTVEIPYISNHMPNAPKINGEALERYNEFGY